METDVRENSLGGILSGRHSNTKAHKSQRAELAFRRGTIWSDSNKQVVGESAEEEQLEGRSAPEERHLGGCQGGLGLIGLGGLGGLSGVGGLGSNCPGSVLAHHLIILCQIKALQLLQLISALTQRGYGGGLGCLGLGGLGGLGLFSGAGGLNCAGGGLGLSGGLIGWSAGLSSGDHHHHHGGYGEGSIDDFGNEFEGFDSGHQRSSNFNITSNEAGEVSEEKERGRGFDVAWWPRQEQALERT